MLQRRPVNSDWVNNNKKVNKDWKQVKVNWKVNCEIRLAAKISVLIKRVIDYILPLILVRLKIVETPNEICNGQ